MHLRPALAILAAAALGTSAAGCQREEPKLAALKEETVASLTPPGGALVLENEAEEHTALGKPVTAQILRAFSFKNRQEAVSARNFVVDAAKDSGWLLHRRPDSRFDLVYGAKTLSTGPATLTIGTSRFRGADTVSILLEHVACPEAMCPAPS